MPVGQQVAGPLGAGPQVDLHRRIEADLGKLDEDIGTGVQKMNQIIDYASGAEWGLGLMALSNAFKQFNKWVLERLNEQQSIYSCYADIFL